MLYTSSSARSPARIKIKYFVLFQFGFGYFAINTVPPLRRTKGFLTSISTGLASGAGPALEVIMSLTHGTFGMQYPYSVSRNLLAIFLLAWVMPSPDQHLSQHAL